MADRRDSKNRKLNKGEYQRSDGRYAYRYVDTDGVERWVYSWRLTDTDRPPSGKDYTESLRELEVKISKTLVDGIKLHSAKQTTLNDCFDLYIELKIKIKEKTKYYYKGLWNRSVRQSLGRRSIVDIKYSDLSKFFADLVQTRGLKTSSVKNLYHLMKPVFTLAVRNKLISSNPIEGVLTDILRNQNEETKRRNVLSESEQTAFLNFLNDTPRHRRWYRLFIFLVGTGCRISEALGLTWSDCDFKNGLIHIGHQLSYYRSEGEEKYREHISTPKTKTSYREIPMFDAVREVLLEERSIQERHERASIVIDGVSGFIFQTRSGNCIDGRNVDSAIKRLIANYNKKENESASAEGRTPLLLPHFSAHSFRHTFCTRMCENETNLKVVQEVMGHASISTTMNIYNEALTDVKIKSFKSLEGKIVNL